MSIHLSVGKLFGAGDQPYFQNVTCTGQTCSESTIIIQIIRAQV